MDKKIYVSLLEKNLSTSKSGNPWTKRGRGAVRWGPRDYVLWENGKIVDIPGCLTPGGISEEEARAFVATGKMPVRRTSTSPQAPKWIVDAFAKHPGARFAVHATSDEGDSTHWEFFENVNDALAEAKSWVEQTGNDRVVCALAGRLFRRVAMVKLVPATTEIIYD